ncbi:MAG: two-component system sensor histidine kinase NtrB [Calditerrivibrio sp.]|jgi:signal transduction histidine kinase|uniref:two-component system sensor histidine kinase NtrB n=1 Tax=Calditerrivibrio sp. TaxID=2792612 RepID=UPI003D0D730C
MYYKKIFDLLPDYIFIHDKDGYIKKMNNTSLKYFKGCENIYTIIKEERIINKIYNHSSDLPLKAGETSLILPNRDKIVINITSRNFETSFSKHYKLTIFKDITHVKDVEKQFCIAQKQEAIGAMAAGFAHDFKNILNNIKLYLRLIMQSGDLSQVSKYAGIIENMIQDSNNFIRHVLNVTRDTSANYEEVMIGELIREDLNIIERILPKNINIDFIDMAKNAIVRLIRSRFTQVIFNLVLNSVEAIGQNSGDILISIERTNIKEKPFVKLSISDNGPGIPANIIDRIFEMFFTTKPNGSGLGLSMVKMAINDFGGYISVESQEGSSTTFKIFLPEVVYGESV